MSVTFAWDYASRNPWESVSPACPKGHSQKFVVAYDVDSFGNKLELFWKCQACGDIFHSAKTQAVKADANRVIIKEAKK